MDECEHVDYAEEGWKCVDEALRRGGQAALLDGRSAVWRSSPGSFSAAYPEKTHCSLCFLPDSVALTVTKRTRL